MYENSKSLITITEELFSEFQQIKTNNYNYSRILSKTEELETYIVHKKWIYRQLREPGSLSISILLLLILAETSKMQPNNHCFFICILATKILGRNGLFCTKQKYIKCYTH